MALILAIFGHYIYFGIYNQEIVVSVSAHLYHILFNWVKQDAKAIGQFTLTKMQKYTNTSKFHQSS